MADGFNINIDSSKTQTVLKIDSAIRQATPDILRQVSSTVLAIIRKNTPVGIKYQSFGQTKKGTAKTRIAKKAAKGFESRIGQRFKGQYVGSGELKKSWNKGIIQGNSVTVETDLRYAGILEVGGYPGVGKPRFGLISGSVAQVSPRTVQEGGGIFSSRAKGGILKPVVEDQNVLRKIIRTVRTEILRQLGH